jgi:hypothetical protein
MFINHFNLGQVFKHCIYAHLNIYILKKKGWMKTNILYKYKGKKKKFSRPEKHNKTKTKLVKEK